jgi:sugar phosphate permease
VTDRRGADDGGFVTDTRGADDGGVVTDRRIAGLMGLEAVSLAVFAALHLASAIHGHGKSYKGNGAGVAEAVICVILVAGAISLWCAPARGRTNALAAICFAIIGFIVGLTFTLQGGAAVDLVYHCTVLPLLVATLVGLVRAPAGVGRTAAR